MKTITASLLAFMLAGALPGVAQDQSAAPQAPNAPTAPAGGWRKFDPQTDQQQVAADPLPPPAGDPGDQQQGPPPPPQQQGPPPPRYAPTTVTLPAGSWVTIRLNEPLSSDHNQTGDVFTGTLLEPIVANGLLIAHRGETVTGVVTEAQKAGRVSGVSHLKLELTGIQLADGRQIQVKTKLINHRERYFHRTRHALCYRSHNGNGCGDRRGSERWSGSGSGRCGWPGGFHHWRSVYTRPCHGGWS